MNLYVPEIGDELKLTEDWTFTLYAEYRNEGLASYFKHYLAGGGWIDEEAIPPMRPADYKVEYPEQPKQRGGLFFNNDNSWDEYNKACRRAEQNNPEYVQYQKDYTAWLNKIQRNGKEEMIVTIPAGTVLKVDRIYIRKGVSDYSSLSFFAHLGVTEVTRVGRWSGGAKKTKKNALRFWAKLHECNNIKFERP